MANNNEEPLIFVVDDDVDFLELIGHFLEKKGYRVKKFDSGSGIIDACEINYPDLILMDAHMPIMHGYAVCSILKNNKKTSEIPIIIVSATDSDNEESVNSAFDAGAEEYITKPIKWPILHQRIRIFLERKKNLLALQASEQKLRDITNSTADAIISIDANDNIVFWNDGAINVFGYTSTEIIGESITKLISKKFDKKCIKKFEQFLKTGRTKQKNSTIELIGLRNDSRHVPIEISLSSWNVENKNFISVVVRDITERKAMLDNADIDLFDTRIIKQMYFLWLKSDAQDDTDELSFKNLKIIMEMVFLASIQKEENEAIQLAVSFIDYSYFLENRINMDTILKFKNPLPFTLDSLVKLAPGFDSETTSFAVSIDKNNSNDLIIWGAIFTSIRGKTRISPYPFPQETLDVLTVTSVKPGSLTISRGGITLATFNSGRFSEVSVGNNITCPFSEILLQGIKDHVGYKDNKEAYLTIYYEFLNYLIAETAKRSHGASIIWIPEKHITRSRVSLIKKYPLTKEQNIQQTIIDLCNLEKERVELSTPDKNGCLVENGINGKVLEDTINECKRRLLDYATFLSQLAKIDGALIISDKLTPLSFGTVLSAPQWKKNVYYCRPSTNFSNVKQSVNMTKYGTRHSSALNFVGKYPGVLAFVISEDGPISCLFRANDINVDWIPDYLDYKNDELYIAEKKNN